MAWWGKVIGGTFGFMLGGFLGALLGAALGHQFDKGLSFSSLDGFGYGGNQETIQMAFFTALFSVMGHVAKADGQVSADEIAMARSIMQQMDLDEKQTRVAIDLFNQGKQPEFDLHAAVSQFRQEAHRRTSLMRMFLELLIHAAYADNHLHDKEDRVLRQISQQLGFSDRYFDQLDAMVRAQRTFHAGGQASPQTQARLLSDAYQVLGVDQSANDAEVKKAYRRLMNQHHPDKLVSRGMPEEMVKLATEKTQDIKAAYEAIKHSRE